MEDTAYSIIVRELEESKGVSADKISEDARFIEDLGIDSLDIVIMLAGIEDRLGIEVPDEALLSMKTVGTAAAHIAALAGIESGVSAEQSSAADEDISDTDI